MAGKCDAFVGLPDHLQGLARSILPVLRRRGGLEEGRLQRQPTRLAGQVDIEYLGPVAQTTVLAGAAGALQVEGDLRIFERQFQVLGRLGLPRAILTGGGELKERGFQA